MRLGILQSDLLQEEASVVGEVGNDISSGYSGNTYRSQEDVETVAVDFQRLGSET
jgi:hypothetical protein